MHNRRIRPIWNSVFAAAVVATLALGRASAQCPPLPYQLTNGQAADATQVMANFNALRTCINSAPGGSSQSVQVNNGAGGFAGVGPLTSGQLLIGSGGAGPVPGTLSAGTGISITNGAGTITIAANGATGPSPTIRGALAQASNNDQYTVTWPSGSQAGDFAVILAGHGWAINAPLGWATADNEAGSNWNGAVFYRTLSASDITAGSVIVTTQGGFDGTVAIITFVGPTGGLRMPGAYQRSGSAPTSTEVLNSDGSPQLSDVGIYFGSNRAASTNAVTLGAQQASANDGSAASSVLNAGLVTTTGGVSPTFSYSSVGSGGFYNVAVFVKAPGT